MPYNTMKQHLADPSSGEIAIRYRQVGDAPPRAALLGPSMWHSPTVHALLDFLFLSHSLAASSHLPPPSPLLLKSRLLPCTRVGAPGVRIH